MDTLIHKIFFWIMKIHIFWGDLTDISAKKEALIEIRKKLGGFRATNPSSPIDTALLHNGFRNNPDTSYTSGLSGL